MESFYSAIDLRGYPSQYFAKTAIVKEVNIENYRDVIDSFVDNKHKNSLFGIEINDESKNVKKIVRKADSMDVIFLRVGIQRKIAEALKNKELTLVSNQIISIVCVSI